MQFYTVFFPPPKKKFFHNYSISTLPFDTTCLYSSLIVEDKISHIYQTTKSQFNVYILNFWRLDRKWRKYMKRIVEAFLEL